MNWEAIGAIGELLGALAVFVTLIYLAVQIRQNTRTMEANQQYAKAQAYQARADTAIEVVKLTDPDVMAQSSSGEALRIEIEELRSMDPLSRAK